MEEPHRGNPSARTVPAAVDAALGAAALATSAAVSLTRLLARAAAPVRRLVMHPPVLERKACIRPVSSRPSPAGGT